MARARNIKPALFKNEDLGQEDPFVTILFIGLWCLADREGMIEDRPLRIKAELFPYRDNFDINGYLTVLERLGNIRRFTYAGSEEIKVIHVVNFKKHQNPHHTEKGVLIPSFSSSCVVTVTSPLNNGYAPADSLIPDSLIPDSLIPEKTATAKVEKFVFVLPEWIDKQKWDLWQKTRKGKKMLPEQMQAQVEKLRKWKDAGMDYSLALSESADNGWTGLFEPKPKQVNFPPPRQSRMSLDGIDYTVGLNSDGSLM